MRYTLQPIKPGSSPGSYVVDFTSAAADQRPVSCLIGEDASGKVWIDPASMQITRLELKVPHHGIFPTTEFGEPMPALVGSWEISVLYDPVALDGRTFWMPATISSSTMTKSVDWTFKASYRNYHKLEVTSRILPEGASP